MCVPQGICSSAFFCACNSPDRMLDARWSHYDNMHGQQDCRDGSSRAEVLIGAFGPARRRDANRLLCITMIFLGSFKAALDMRSDMNKPVRMVVNTEDEAVLAQIRAALADQPLELICDPADCAQAPLCRWLAPEELNDCGLLAGAIQDAIVTLEQTRHAFRSKQLGGLRRRLEKLLQELPDAAK